MSKQVSLKVQRFLTELGMMPESVNGTVNDYSAQAAAERGIPRTADGNSGPPPLEVFALREVADICYHSGDMGSTLPPVVAKLDFSKDESSAIKMRLVALKRQQRIDTLVQELSAEDADPSLDNCRMQLLCDEGPDVRTAIVKRIAQFRADPKLNQDEFNTSRARTVLADTYDNIDSGAPVATLEVPLLDKLTATGQAHPLRRLYLAEY